MWSTRRVRTIVAIFATACAGVACQGRAALEEITPGTDVAIELQDGRQVVGKLVSVDPDVVAVEGAARVRVNRTEIASVQAGEAAREAATRQVILPAGTTLEAELETTIASQTSQVEDLVRAVLTMPLVAGGAAVAPSGSVLLGTVTSARESGRVKGRAELGIRFTQLQTRTVTYDIRTAPLRWVAEATKGEDAAKIGIGAAAGAIVGGITGGGKGAAVGSAIGAGGGSAVVLATKGDEIEMASGSSLRVELIEPLSASVPAAE
ncbi:MAG: hypothetical protein ACRD3C_17425 [Vicinamibacterales bacterium]